MSTMLPDEMLGGSRMEGNSILDELATESHSSRDAIGTYQALVRRQENRDAGVDLADSKGDKHDDERRKPAHKLV